MKKVLFCDPAADGKKYLALQWLVNLLCIVIWSFGLGAVSLYFGRAGHGWALFFSYFRRADLLVLNLLPVLLLTLLLFLLFNRVWPAFLGSGLLVLLLSLIHYFKLQFRYDPLLATDIGYFSEAVQISSRYDVSFTPAMILCFAAVLGASAFAFFLLKARFRTPLPRVIFLVLLLGAGAGLYRGVYIDPKVYDAAANFVVELPADKKLNKWVATDQYCCRGFLYPLINSASLVGSDRPEGYSKSKAVTALAEHEDADIPAGEKVNIVSIMLEAYNDFSTYGDLFPFDIDPYAYFHELQSESYHGTLVTNVFSAGTVDTERCFVTGSTRMYDYRNAAWSFVRYFDDQGYRTEFCHPSYQWFYNRKNIMEYLGFREGWFYENRYNTLPPEWGIMGDNRFFPDLAQLFDESVAAGEPYFSFSVTYQNHGPYATDRLVDPENVFLPRGALSETSYTILNNYFYNISRTNESLRELVAHFRESDEPVVLVLFGDHKPWLGNGSSVYAELGIDLSCSDEESFYNYYCTQYTIWANDAAKEILGNDFRGEGETLSPCFLMMKLFDLCGWEGPGYLQAERELFKTVTVVSATGRCVENGVLTGTLSPTAQEQLDKLRYMHYYFMRDWSKEAGRDAG